MKKLFLLAFLIHLLNSMTGQQNITGEFAYDGQNRTYRLHIPTAYETGASLPLVISMHGYGSNATEQEFYSAFNPIADTANFFVVYPQGLLDNTGTPHWNSYFNSTVDDVGFLNLLIDYLYTDYNIDLNRVYATGMSNGGFMSYRLACELSDRIAAMASVTGAMTFTQFNNCQPDRPIPVMQIHGTSDAVVPYNGTNNFFPPIPDIVDFWVQHNACDLPAIFTDVPNTNTGDNSTASFQHYNRCDGSTEVIFYTVQNGGHSWPGAFPVPTLGNTNQDFKASETIWRFFNRFSHPSPTPGTIISSRQEIIADDLIQVFPNPFTSSVKLNMNFQEAATVQLFDAKGRLVLITRTEAPTTNVTLETTALNVGLYYLKVTTENGVWNSKIVKN